MLISIILERPGKADCPVVLLPKNRRAGWRVGCVWQGVSAWERPRSLVRPRESRLLCSLQCEPLHDPVNNLNALSRSQANVDVFFQDCKEKRPAKMRKETEKTGGN